MEERGRRKEEGEEGHLRSTLVTLVLEHADLLRLHEREERGREEQ
jgi:hypothetical protein